MARKQKIHSVHLHVLLWNLRAHRSNAKNAPAGSVWQDFRDAAIKRIPEYEAEFVRRGIPVPAADTTEAQWEVLLAQALEPMKVSA